MELVGLVGLEDRSPFALSGGQQQRLACAAVLAMRPTVLFLDEPTSNLDPVGKTELLAVADRLHRERGMTVLIAEHETEALAEYADRIVVLDGGRIVMDGPPAAVLSRVDELAALGLRAPQVAAFAHALRPDATDVPITVPAAVAWLETPWSEQPAPPAVVLRDVRYAYAGGVVAVDGVSCRSQRARS